MEHGARWGHLKAFRTEGPRISLSPATDKPLHPPPVGNLADSRPHGRAARARARVSTCTQARRAQPTQSGRQPASNPAGLLTDPIVPVLPRSAQASATAAARLLKAGAVPCRESSPKIRRQIVSIRREVQREDKARVGP